MILLNQADAICTHLACDQGTLYAILNTDRRPFLN